LLRLPWQKTIGSADEHPDPGFPFEMQIPRIPAKNSRDTLKGPPDVSQPWPTERMSCEVTPKIPPRNRKIILNSNLRKTPENGREGRRAGDNLFLEGGNPV
jgi:hypothetical protein